MAIRSESDLIDVNAINNACAKMEEASAAFANCATKLNESGSYLSGDALSVDGKNLQPTLEELATAVAQGQEYVYSITANIRSAANQIYYNQQQELAAYREQQRLAQQQAQQNGR